MVLILPDRVLVIDGGNSTQLSVHVGDKVDGDPLWSARFNATNPQAVVQTHLDFLRAGSDVILTNTYQASVEGYMKHLQLDREQSVALIGTTVGLAQAARKAFLDEGGAGYPWVVGSIGPYGAHLNDGSEYTGDYADRVTKEDIKQWHRVRLDAVLAAGVDALAIETIPCSIEAEAMVELLISEYPTTKFWMSFQCKDDGVHLAHGEVFADVARRAWNLVAEAGSTNLLAVGVNCLNPQHVSPLFRSLNDSVDGHEKLPLVVYPNSGEVYDVKAGWTGKADCVPLEQYAPEWIALGVRFIGGCCRTFAADIKRIRDTVSKVNSTRVLA